MPSELKARLEADTKQALKSGAKVRLSNLRFILAAIKQQEIDTRADLDDTTVLAVLTKLANQHRESIKQFEAAGRDDLASKEKEELQLLTDYLPSPLSEEEIDDAINAAIDATDAQSIKDMGKVMANLKPQITGRADAGAVSKKVKGRLTSS